MKGENKDAIKWDEGLNTKIKQLLLHTWKTMLLS